MPLRRGLQERGVTERFNSSGAGRRNTRTCGKKEPASIRWSLDHTVRGTKSEPGGIREEELLLVRDADERRHTLVVFLSDNGGATTNSSWNGPLSGAKGTMREGGIRVPFIVSWPSVLSPDGTYTSTVSALDLLPTFMAAAGAELLPLSPHPSHEDPTNRIKSDRLYGTYDGIDLLPLLAGNRDAQPRTLFWRLQGQTAIMRDSIKLISLSHRPAQLFNVVADLGEQTDLAGGDPAELQELFSMLGEWQASLATVPLWGSSPRWTGDSAEIYDTWQPRPEPQ